MFFAGIISIVLFAVLSILCIVFTIIYFGGSKKGKFTWLIFFFICLAGLIGSVFFTINRAIKGVEKFAHKMEETFIKGIDTAAFRNYNFADSLKSQQIKYLKLSEPKEYQGKVPSQFYNYLGFRDYYRLPLVYPFSLHCTDVLDNAILFNEADVIKFDANDNGERELDIKNIIEFAFDKNLLLAKQSYNSKLKEKDIYIIYRFSSGKTEEFKTFNEMSASAKTLGYSRPVNLHNCRAYYKLF